MRIPTRKYILGSTEHPGFVISNLSACGSDNDRLS
jgi:hypothetical protein